ncbi:MAG: type I asparaginase [Bacteroides sp.]|nr:type I asparaginase [Bacteroides sp.]
METTNFFFKPRKRVMLIYTGGTIGMIRNPETGALETFNFDHLRKHVPELNQFDYVIHSYQFDPPIDSSDMEPTLWVKLVKIINYNYHNFDGFVILHGTDTMAYTASALSFMLENIAKPVILTGSQLPIGVLRTDGKENLIAAIELAAAQDDEGNPLVPEVCVFFGQHLLRGNRTTKSNAENFNAFSSYNCPELAHTGININYNYGNIRKPDLSRPFSPHFEYENCVLALTLFPGIRKDLIEHVFNLDNIRGIILRTYGSGNAPRRQWLIDAIKKATTEGKVVVNITQCQCGGVEMGLYETGLQLLSAGVVSGRDMTIEAAITKLMVLFGRGYSADEVRQLMNTSLAGEITE